MINEQPIETITFFFILTIILLIGLSGLGNHEQKQLWEAQTFIPEEINCDYNPHVHECYGITKTYNTYLNGIGNTIVYDCSGNINEGKCEPYIMMSAYYENNTITTCQIGTWKEVFR